MSTDASTDASTSTSTNTSNADRPAGASRGGRRAPCRGATLVDSLLEQAAAKGDARHLVLLSDTGEEETVLTFAQLADGARAVARALRVREIGSGDTVALMLPTGVGFFYTFLGALLVGAVPVPIFPPVRVGELEEYVDRHSGILKNAAVKLLVIVDEAKLMGRLLKPRVASLEHVVRAEELLEEGRGEKGDAVVPVEPSDLALIQYTSGSTGQPKGVCLSHENLLANIRAIGEAVEVVEDDVVVSWLPLYHDMGLIGCWLFSVCHGLEIVALSPLAFLRRPKRWLRAITDYRGSLSPAPNFAYELCVRRIKDRDLEGVDLSTWRWALNGAEPISPTTLERFCERFAPHGFRLETMKPVYGLAENAVALTFPAGDTAPRIEELERDAFQKRGRAVPIADGAKGEPLRFVVVGRAIPGHEVRVVGDESQEVGERVEGHIEFRGPSATPGYYKNAEATDAIKTPDGWTRTGDLGYLADGELVITGRSKDLIIKGGRNVYPQEVEAITAEIEGVRRGCVAAFSVPLPESGEGMAVVAETRETREEKRRHMTVEIRRHLTLSIGVAPDAVELVPPQTIPKTPSGKLRRAETRDRFLAGNLSRGDTPAWVQVGKMAVSGVWQGLKKSLGGIFRRG